MTILLWKAREMRGGLVGNSQLKAVGISRACPMSSLSRLLKAISNNDNTYTQNSAYLTEGKPRLLKQLSAQG